MAIVADAHVHVYGCHDAGALLSAASGNLAAIGGADATRLLLLTERAECDFFARLAGGRAATGAWHPLPSPEPGTVPLEGSDGGTLLVVAGRQIVTRERLEVLALTVDLRLPDGMPLVEVIAEVAASGGIPTLAWAPGKWLLARGRAVAAAMDRFPPPMLALGDSTLRPVGWPEPSPMRRAAAEGRAVLAGSDPLPFPGEETKTGRYGILVDGTLDPERPLTSLRSLLAGGGGIRRVGRRDGPLEVARRLHRLRRSR